MHDVTTRSRIYCIMYIDRYIDKRSNGKIRYKIQKLASCKYICIYILLDARQSENGPDIEKNKNIE